MPIDGVDTMQVGICLEDITIVEDETNRAVVTVVEPMDNENFLYMKLDGHELTARIYPSLCPQECEKVLFTFERCGLYLFDPETGKSLKTKTDAIDAVINAVANDWRDSRYIRIVDFESFGPVAGLRSTADRSRTASRSSFTP